MDLDVLETLLRKIAEGKSDIGDADAINKVGHISGRKLEMKLQRHVLKLLVEDQGREIPNGFRMLARVRDQERRLAAAEKEIFAQQWTGMTEKMRATPDDMKAGRRRRRELERDIRKMKGECVDCPKGKVRPAAAGKIRCDECGEKNNARSRKFRHRKKTQGPVQSPPKTQA